MATCILEQIAAALETVLKGITVANGYTLDVGPVVRRTRVEGFAPEDRAIVLAQEDPEEDGEYEGGGSFRGWVQPFSIYCFRQASEKDLADLDTRINAIRADVEKAVRADPTLGALATDTRVRVPDLWALKSAAFEGVTVHVDVHYLTKEDDPYSH